MKRRSAPGGARSRLPKGKRKASPSGGLFEATAQPRSGGFVPLLTDDGERLLCARARAKGALPGDRVSARRAGGEYATVERVLARAHERLCGVLEEGPRGLTLRPASRQLPRRVAIGGPLCGARPGDAVCARVVRWEGGLLAQVEERLGDADDAQASLDALILTERLPQAFDEEALAQADACRAADLRDDPEREDLRALTLFTIDGADAKDFDDAVSVEPLEGGCARLGVHIADVGHYVPQGTPLDRAAWARGTSVYLPGRVLPMLPHALSDGVCSLRPGEDKFALSALMDVDAAGEVRRLRLARTIIRSRARLVYADVNAMFAGDAGQRARMEAQGVADALHTMRALAGRIRARREAAGCVDFELPEPQFALDVQGQPVAMAVRARGEAERMIEDFMLAANESVARFARERRLPLLYRVHETPDPDKLSALADALDALALPSRGLRARDARSAALREALAAAQGREEYPAIAAMALRSMQRARYDAKPLGHYALALSDYCHFTSPIRRYPDLVVSRALTAALTGNMPALTGEALAEAAAQSSERERVAAQAERMGDRVMAAHYLSDRVGEAFDGVIAGVSASGAYVALPCGAEGLLSTRSLGEWFALDERRMELRGEATGRVLRVGQALRVIVTGVRPIAGEIDLAEEDSAARGEDRGRAHGRSHEGRRDARGRRRR